MNTELKIINFNDLIVGMRVQDGDGNIGTVIECNDVHNVSVEYDNNRGGGLYCLSEKCSEGEEAEMQHYDPLYHV